MLARFRVLLPYDIFVPLSVDLEPVRLNRGADTFVVQPPMQAQIYRGDEAMTSGVAIRTVLERLAPQVPPFVANTVLVNGENAYPANLFEIHVRRDAFDRRPRNPSNPLAGDTLVEEFFAVANQCLHSIRRIVSTPVVKPIWPVTTFWRIDFLADDGEPLPEDRANVRRRMLAPTRWQACGLTREAWQKAHSTVDNPHRPWETLILDAEAILPEVGPAVVLAAAALETLITIALDELASTTAVPPDLWDWINDRGDYRKEPSVVERYDILLRMIAGVSLKDDPALWEAFDQLRAARNSFAHRGVATIGKRRPEPLTPQKADELIKTAKQIVLRVETLLPASARTERLRNVVVEVFKPTREPTGEKRPA